MNRWQTGRRTLRSVQVIPSSTESVADAPGAARILARYFGVVRYGRIKDILNAALVQRPLRDISSSTADE